MALTEAQKEAKARYFKKKYDEAPMVECACGCGEQMKSVDEYGRPKTYLTGHNGRKYPHDDPHAHQKAWVKRNRAWANERRQKIARERKVQFIERLGGKCDHCGLEYNGSNGAVFEFHHDDPTTKEFGLGSELTNKSFAALKKEVDKCQLLCANCHQIHHLGEY